MNVLFIRQYIKRMRPIDVRNFALNNNIILSDSEVNSVYNYIKKNYDDYLQGKINPDNLCKDAKKILSDDNYSKFIKLYQVYKNKI